MYRLGMQTTETSRAARRGSARLKLAFAVVAATALAGCQSPEPVAYQAPPLSADERFPIQLTEEPVTLEVPVTPAFRALTAGQKAEITGFMRAFRKDGGGQLVVRTPSGSRNEVAALGVVEEIRALAAYAEVPAGAVKYSVYSGRKAGAPHPPVVLAYSGVKAQAAECGDWSVNVAVNYDNTPYPNFGCATQRNLAAMVSNPRDLAAPRATDPAPAERRQTVREKYILGEPTGSQTQDEKAGAVSTVAQ